jgi:hypothetical protein
MNFVIFYFMGILLTIGFIYGFGYFMSWFELKVLPQSKPEDVKP